MNAITQDLVLLSGIPASGKSTFGRWLALTHNWVHVDLEGGDLERHGLAEAWSRAAVAPSASPQAFVDALRAMDQSVAVDWGYPPAWLPFVEAMHRAGVTAWWFDGDRNVARRRFLERGTVSVQALDLQMHRIQQVESALRRFYVDRMIKAVGTDGTYSDPAIIYQRMFPDRQQAIG